MDGQRIGLRSAIATVVALVVISPARADVMLQATLDAAQEVPAPTGVPANAGGTATFTFNDETKILTYTVSIHDLTGAPIAAHVHQAPPGTPGPIIFPLTATATSGTVGTLTAAQEQTLFSGGFYINFHTAMNPSGEIRGQITLVPGSCGCNAATNHGQFISCVKKAIHQLDKADRKDAGIMALKRAIKKSSCGRKSSPKKSTACCLARTPEANIVTDALCAAVKKETQCTGLGGTPKSGPTCTPTNPCSPSGAFVDPTEL